MAEKQISTVRERHKAIAHYLVANPKASQAEVAKEFNLTQAWVSILVNSDCFQDYLAELDQDFRHAVLTPIREKLVGVASRAVEKLGEAVDNSQDPDFILAAADKTLHRLGYAPSRGPEAAAPSSQVNVQNNYYVSKDALAQARGRMLEMSKEKHALPAPEELPAR